MSSTAELKDPPRIGPYHVKGPHHVKGVENTSSTRQIKGYQINYSWFIIHYYKINFEME